MVDAVPSDSDPAVTLFADTFTNHYDPHIGQDAAAVLRHAGHRVEVVRPGCCGRPLISQGLLAEARAHAQRLVASLHPVAATGRRILFCEPSCLSSVKEDAPSLVPTREAREVAAAAMLWDEFAAGCDLRLRSGPARVLLHGHCHQKSMGLLRATQALLAKIPGAAIVDLDAGCCGMAGSFGYVREHYDVSRTIAERKLLPAVRAMGPGDILVAPGTSCRHQVADLDGRLAQHPASVVARLVQE
jgi:Fe-S oxidoreductase